MWQTWIDKWRAMAAGRSATSVKPPTTQIVPHPDWSQWLAEGRWDSAAVCLEDYRKRYQDLPELTILMPQWQGRLVESFLSRSWSDLAPESALRWLRRVDRFADRGLFDPRLEAFRQVADLMWDASRAQSQGDCRAALAKLDQAERQMPPSGNGSCDRNQAFRRQLIQTQELIAEWSMQMRIHSDDGHQAQAQALARRIAEIAPEHPGAFSVLRMKRQPVTLPHEMSPPGDSLRMVDRPPEVALEKAIESDFNRAITNHPETHPLWQVSLDRADSWLLTRSDNLAFSALIDSRLADALGHDFKLDQVQLQRDEEGCWLIQATADVLWINSRPVLSSCLMDGSMVRFGSGPELRFVQPRMETGSARLERTGRASPEGQRGLVLMGELLEVGHGSMAEIPHSEMVSPLVLINRARQLLARCDSAWSVNGTIVVDEAPIEPPCRMRLKDIGIYWEV